MYQNYLATHREKSYDTQMCRKTMFERLDTGFPRYSRGLRSRKISIRE
jgi:hypothetical protein